MHIQRIAKTARLAGVTGSIEKRRDLASSFCEEFYQRVNKKLEKNGFIPRRGLENIFNELTPNVRLKVIWGDGGALGVRYDRKRKMVNGYFICLPFAEKRLTKDPEDIGNLCHEADHFFTYITRPAHTARFMLGKLSISKTNSEYKFYKNKIYAPSCFIKKRIVNFFHNNNFLTKEKIEALQGWRYGLKGEISAYKTGAFSNIQYIYDFQKSNKLKHPAYKNNEEKIMAQYQEYLHSPGCQYFFDRKLKIIEKMLVDEIAKARNEHKMQLMEKRKANGK